MPDSRRRTRGLVNRLARPLLAVAFLAQIVVPLGRIATSYRATEAALSPALVLALSSAFALLPALLAVSMGRYNDRHGSGHAAIYGSLLLTAGCLLLFLPLPGMAWLLLASVLLGVGQTLQLTALQAEVAAMRSPAQRERMIGGLMLWQAVGQVGAPLLLSAVAVLGSELTRNLSLVTTVLAGITTVLSLSLLRHAAQPKPTKAPARISDIVAIRGFPWIVAGGSLCVAVQDLTLVYLPVVGEQQGIPPATIGVMLAFFAVTQMLSRAAYPRVATRLGLQRLMWFSVLGTGVMTAFLALPVGEVVLTGFLSLSGFFLGFAITASVALTIKIAPPAARSTSLGLRLSINRFGQFAIPAMAGLIASAQAGAVFLLLGMVVAGTGVFGFRKRS